VIAKLTTRGRVTIPVALRRKFNIQPGQKMAFYMDEDGFRMKKVRSTKSKSRSKK